MQHYYVREAEPMLAEGDVARRLTAVSLDIALAVGGRAIRLISGRCPGHAARVRDVQRRCGR